MFRTSKIVAFVSNISEIRYVLSDHATKLDGLVYFICMTPAVEYAAKKMCIEYSSIEELYDPVALMEVASATYESNERFAKYLDFEINAAFNDICANGYFESLLFLPLLKTINDSVFGKLFTLLSTLERLSPDRVLCFINSEKAHYYDQNFYMGDIILQLLQLLKGRFRYDLLAYRINVSGQVTPSEKNIRILFRVFKQRIGGRITRLLRQVKLSVRSLFRQNRDLVAIAIGRSNYWANLFPLTVGWQNIGGNVNSIAAAMSDYKFVTADIDGNTSLKTFGVTTTALDRFWDELSAKPEFIGWFEHDGINYSSVIMAWLKQLICFNLPNCVIASEIIEKKLRQCGASAFLTPSVVHVLECAALLACRRLGIKICSVQHGAMGYFKAPVLEYTDYRGMDYAFVSGEGVSDFFKKEFCLDSDEGKARPIAIGTLELHNLFNEQRSRLRLSPGTKRRILYIPTHFMPNFDYYGWNRYPNIWYSRLQRRIANIISQYPEVTMFFKNYPAETIEDPLRIYVKDEGINNIEFLPNYYDMLRYIDEVDLFIIDFPTTSLLKMLCTRKPIIAYYNPKYFRMDQHARIILSKRVELCLKEEEFEGKILEYCSRQNWPELKDPDDTFLIHYGICNSCIDPRKQVVKHFMSTSVELGE